MNHAENSIQRLTDLNDRQKRAQMQHFGQIEKAFGIIRSLIFFLFLLVSGWIICMIIWSGTEKYSFLFPVLTAVLAGALLAGRERVRNLLLRLSGRKCVITGAVLALAGFAGMLLIAFAVRNRIEENWDYGIVFETAAGMAADNTPIPQLRQYYFAMYGNNTLFLRVLTGILRLFVMITGKKDPYFLLDCSIVLNCVLIILAVLACAVSIGRLRSAQQGLLAEFFLLLMSPFYLYAAFTYTDVYGLLPAVLVLFSVGNAMPMKAGFRQDLLIGLAAAAAAFGYMIKGTVIIYLLTAFFVICFSKEFSGKRLRLLAVYTVTAILMVIALTWTNHRFLAENGISDTYREQIEFPPAHFLMMAMNPDNVGQYDSLDVDYTQSYAGKQAKTEADLRLLKDRISQMGAAGTLEHVFVKKAKFTYGTGTAGAPNYIVRDPVKKSKTVDFLGRNRTFFEVTLLYKAMLEGFILIMSLLVWFRKKEEDGLALFLKICWIGMFLFFCIWETHPRYTFLFLPVTGLLAAGYVCGDRRSFSRST